MPSLCPTSYIVRHRVYSVSQHTTQHTQHCCIHTLCYDRGTRQHPTADNHGQPRVCGRDTGHPTSSLFRQHVPRPQQDTSALSPALNALGAVRLESLSRLTRFDIVHRRQRHHNPSMILCILYHTLELVPLCPLRAHKAHNRMKHRPDLLLAYAQPPSHPV